MSELQDTRIGLGDKKSSRSGNRIRSEASKAAPHPASRRCHGRRFASAAEVSYPPHSMARILIVEDSAAMRTYVARRWKERRGIGEVEIVEAASGFDCPAAVPRSAYDSCHDITCRTSTAGAHPVRRQAPPPAIASLIISTQSAERGQKARLALRRTRPRKPSPGGAPRRGSRGVRRAPREHRKTKSGRPRCRGMTGAREDSSRAAGDRDVSAQIALAR